MHGSRKVQSGGASYSSVMVHLVLVVLPHASNYLKFDAGRAIAGSIVLEGGACACDFKAVEKQSRRKHCVGRLLQVLSTSNFNMR